MRVSAALALLFALGACVAPSPPRSVDPGALVATQDIRGDFLIRQHLRFRFGDEEGAFEAVVQKRCDELTIMGLTPFGLPAFAIHQRGLEVRVESHLPGDWPFPPRYVLLDVHRTYFVPFAELAPAGGVREIRRGAETLVERWDSGRLVERSFHSTSGDPPGRVVVTYPGGATRARTPRRTHLQNERYGYELDVTTVSRSELVCAQAAEGEQPAGP